MYNFYELLDHFEFYRIMPSKKLLPMGVYNSSLETFKYQNILAINKSFKFAL